MTQTRSAAMRGFYALPILDRIARDTSRGTDNIFYALAIFVTLVVLAVKTWGLVALAMTALALVPVMFVILLLITRG
ncbi:MAG TPA: hypothetical protein VGA75_13645 [Paracoccaceae bacterium]